MIFYSEVLKEFQKQKVKYLIVGGIAMNLLGAMRATSDLDILVEMSNEDLKKIVRNALNRGEANLPKKSVVNISQIFTVNKSDLSGKIGTLSKDRIYQVLQGIKLLTEPREVD